MARYDKYEKLKLQYTYGPGEGYWIDVEPPQFKAGKLIESNSPDCGYHSPIYRWFTVPDDSLKPVSMPASFERPKSTRVLGITIEKKSTKQAPMAGLVLRKLRACVPIAPRLLKLGLLFLSFFKGVEYFNVFGC